LMSKI